MLNKKKIHFFLFFTFLLHMSCSQAELSKSDQEYVEDHVRKEIEAYRKEREQACREKIEKRADELADSILQQLFRSLKTDSLHRPAKIPKPGTPEIRKPVDTEMVEPLWPIKDSVDFKKM